MDETVICPIAWRWAEIHQALVRAWEKRQRAGDSIPPPPPKPLILAGWAYSDDEAKRQRWAETVAWAAQYGFAIPTLPPEERYPRPQG
ncbi:hypothetical protein [Armatimonas sp.]|uniref:hypothetical protein n=1 Tax=Armatimonas sp. TaxID=1872638 RepID=UPI00375202B0